MTRFVVESGVVRDQPGMDAMWTECFGFPERGQAVDVMTRIAGDWPVRYGPHGNRRLRVRQAGAVERIERSNG